MNDRKIADAVNEIRDMAVKYRDTQQLRDRIASLMTTILRAQDVARAPLTDEQRIAIQECIGYLTPAAKEFSDLGLPGMGDSKHARCIRTLRSILAPAAPAVAPEGCTPADAQMLRAANHGLAAENDYLRRRLRPFAQIASSPLSWAMVEYCVEGDPEKQTLQAPQMQRAFNRAADALREDVTSAPCATCKGTGFVDDGEITGSGGVEYACGPIKCIKDCPDCAAPAQAEQQGDDSLAFKYGNAIVDRKLDPSYEQQGDGGAAYLRNALEHIAGSCEGRAAEVARCALKNADEQPSARVSLSEAQRTARIAWTADALYEAIEQVLLHYRHSTILTEDMESGYPLTDLLTMNGQSIQMGYDEIRYICDSIYNEVLTKAAPAQAEQQGDGGTRCTCGDTSALNTVHRAHGPCYLAEQPSARVALSDQQILDVFSKFTMYLDTPWQKVQVGRAILAASTAQGGKS